MAKFNFSNGAKTTTTTAVTASDNYVTVSSVSGFPSPPFAALFGAEGSNKDEIVYVISRSSNTYAFLHQTEKIGDGTYGSQSHAAGATFTHVLTSDTLDWASTEYMAYWYF